MWIYNVSYNRYININKKSWKFLPEFQLRQQSSFKPTQLITFNFQLIISFDLILRECQKHLFVTWHSKTLFRSNEKVTSHISEHEFRHSQNPIKFYITQWWNSIKTKPSPHKLINYGTGPFRENFKNWKRKCMGPSSGKLEQWQNRATWTVAPARGYPAINFPGFPGTFVVFPSVFELWWVCLKPTRVFQSG